MSKEATFTVTLEPELRDAFMAEAEATAQPPSQIIRDMISDFVKRRTEERSYNEFLRRKVEIARAQIARGEVFTQEEVEARFAARRAELRKKAGKAGA